MYLSLIQQEGPENACNPDFLFISTSFDAGISFKNPEFV